MPKHEIPANRAKTDRHITDELQAEVGTDKPIRILVERGKVVEIEIEGVTAGQLTAAVNRARAAHPSMF